MRADEFVARAVDGLMQHLFHFRLSRPAALIGRQTQVAIGHQQYLLGFDLGRLDDFRQRKIDRH
jgi:hypothetical protein